MNCAFPGGIRPWCDLNALVRHAAIYSCLESLSIKPEYLISEIHTTTFPALRHLYVNSEGDRHPPLDLTLFRVMPGLVKVFLGYLDIRDSNVEEFAHLPHLTALTVFDTKISSDCILNLLKFLPNSLKELTLLSHKKKFALSDAVYDCLCSFPNLRRYSAHRHPVLVSIWVWVWVCQYVCV